MLERYPSNTKNSIILDHEHIITLFRANRTACLLGEQLTTAKIHIGFRSESIWRLKLQPIKNATGKCYEANVTELGFKNIRGPFLYFDLCDALQGFLVTQHKSLYKSPFPKINTYQSCAFLLSYCFFYLFFDSSTLLLQT